MRDLTFKLIPWVLGLSGALIALELVNRFEQPMMIGLVIIIGLSFAGFAGGRTLSNRLR